MKKLFTTAQSVPRAWGSALAVLFALLVSFSARGELGEKYYPLVNEMFPGATAVTPAKGDRRASAVYRDGTLLGYGFLTDEILPIPAYSGKPISTFVALDAMGTIVGLRIVGHEEPILVIGVTEADLSRYIGQYRGRHAAERVKIGGAERKGYVSVDGISGATITVMVLNRSIMASAKKIAVAHGLSGAPAAAVGSAGGAAPMVDNDPVLDPIWSYVWREQTARTAFLAAGLALLTLILVFQDYLARHPSLLTYLRQGFLLYTLFFIGWYALAQLSVVNVLTFLHSLTHDFSWNTFLIDPMLFILWGYVAVAILLWGRGVYCGWLCPFGALQELLFQLARLLRIPSFEFPLMVHERLFAIKYIILLMLFGLSLGSLQEAVRFSEVEPFKTAIVLRFQREWEFVAYAGGLVVLSVFNRKFFCRYLCPLGAALTFPTRFRIFDWLRRRKECGRPCQTCATECEVGAIGPTGDINERECHYCLDCQITYWNEHKCPPMVERRKRRERHARRSAKASVSVPLVSDPEQPLDLGQ